MYNYENSVTGNVKAEQVWELYSTVARWSRWDIEVESVSLEGSFVTGSSGVMKMKNGQFLPFILEQVEIGTSFISTSKLGDIVLSFGHTLKYNNDGSCTITHTVKIDGGDKSEMEAMGRGITENIPESMKQLLFLSAKI